MPLEDALTPLAPCNNTDDLLKAAPAPAVGDGDFITDDIIINVEHEHTNKANKNEKSA